MNEELHRFGAGGHLAGIVTLPGGRQHNVADTPGVVFITAGLMHKPGPYRLYVRLARTLAASGFPCLRFDLSGIGESGTGGDAEDAESVALRDVGDAMNKLSAENIATRFVLIGLCSGAEVAHRVALRDARVCGVVALDGFILRNAKYYLWHYLPRALSVSKWLDFIGRRLSPRRSGSEPEDEEQTALEFWRGPAPPRAQLEKEFTQLAARGVQQFYIFSGGSGDCSYAGQFRDVFRRVRFNDTLTVHFNRDADHMYILDADRRQLTGAISRWMQQRFSTAPSTRRTGAADVYRTGTTSPVRLAGRRLHE